VARIGGEYHTQSALEQAAQILGYRQGGRNSLLIDRAAGSGSLKLLLLTVIARYRMPTMAVIDRITAKVTRAKQHIQDFQLGLTEFFKTDPYTILVKDAPEIGQRIHYVSHVADVPDPLAAIAADVIQNFRVPVDQIAYQLVLAASSPPSPKDRVYFPISASATDYQATRRGSIKGVRQEVINAIDATEPYKGGKGHALWQLQHMNNPDKHHLLILAISQYIGFDAASLANAMFRSLRQANPSMAARPEFPPILVAPVGKLSPLKVGDELLREPIDHKVYEDLKFAFQVSFYQPGIIEGEPAIKTLHDMANLVGDIIAVLGKLLP